MSTKLYADSRCIAEFFSANELREMVGRDLIEPKEEKKSCNCPNCGAPITSYICEYCGTEFEKPKKTLPDEENDSRLLNLQEKLRQAELQASQEWQTQNLLNTINGYNVNTQIMNMRDSINSVIAYQTCSLHDQMRSASMLTNLYPANHDIEQKEKLLHIESSNKEADALAHWINVLGASLILFLILVLVIIAYNFLE